MLNHIGERYGKLIILKELASEPKEYKGAIRFIRKIVCKCDCGNKVKCSLQAVVYGQKRSCGCVKHKGSFSDKIILEMSPDKNQETTYALSIFACQQIIENWKELLYWFNHPRTKKHPGKRIIYNRHTKYRRGADILILPYNTIVSRRIFPKILKREDEIRNFVKKTHSISNKDEYMSYLTKLEYRVRGAVGVHP